MSEYKCFAMSDSGRNEVTPEQRGHFGYFKKFVYLFSCSLLHDDALIKTDDTVQCDATTISRL